MTPSQRSQEMQKIQNMSTQEKNQILMQNGINPQSIAGGNILSQNTGGGRKFNY